MTTTVTLLTSCEDKCSQLDVISQSVRPHMNSVRHRWPVVMLSHLPADPTSDSVVVTGRRPSDIYGEAARARCRDGRRPLARSAAAIRASRAAKLSVSADDAALLRNCSPSSTPPPPPAASKCNHTSAQEVHEKFPSDVDVVTPVDSSDSTVDGDFTPDAEKPPIEPLVLTITQFYNSSCVAAEGKLVTTLSTRKRAESVGVDGHHTDTGCLPVSPSTYHNRKRKSSREQAAANRVKKTYGCRKTSNRTEKLNSRNASLTVTNRSAWRTRLRNSRRGNATSLNETSPAKEESKPETNFDDATACDDILPVVPIDEKHASTSLAAMNMTDCTTSKPSTDWIEPVTTPELPVGSFSTLDAQSTTDSTVASTGDLQSKKRAKYTIFERFINALSLYRPSEKEDPVSPATLTEAEDNAVSNGVLDAEDETKVVQQVVHKTENKPFVTTDEQLPQGTPIEHDETTKTWPTPAITGSGNNCRPTSDGIARNSAEARDEKLVESGDDAKKCDVGDAEQTPMRRTRGLKPITRYNNEILMSQLMSRPVRRRKPPTYIDANFSKSAISRRKVSIPAKPHGSCLLPNDFDLSMSRSTGAAWKSWKIADLDGSERLTTKRVRGHSKKTTRHYTRRKATAAESEVKWIIHKKLLLGGSALNKPKSTPRSKLNGKQKFKSPPKSSTGRSLGGSEVQTRSVTRTRGIAAEQKAAVTAAQTSDISPAIVVGLPRKNQVHRDRSLSVSSAANSALPCTDDFALSLNVSSSQAPVSTAKSHSPVREQETTSSNAVEITLTTTTTSLSTESVETLDKDDAAVETAPVTSPSQNKEPEVTSADVASANEALLATDQSATKIIGDTATSTSAADTDETKVEDETVERLMYLVKQIHDTVTYDKLRKSTSYSELHLHEH